MSKVVLFCLIANVIVAFGFVFYFHAFVIFRILEMSDPGVGIGNSNSRTANLMRFLQGKLYPELLSKWSKSVMWLAASLLALAVVAEFLQP